MEAFSECHDDYFDELSSSPSISDEDINFDFVYALHTFVATVEGQANVIKGDTLVLLDDSNSYWWLVRLEKDHTVGYLPAEHIETPLERLARLNKYRNAEISSIVVKEHEISFESDKNKHAYNKDNKLVVFSVPTYIEYADEWDDNSKYIGDKLRICKECEKYDCENEISDKHEDQLCAEKFTTQELYVEQASYGDSLNGIIPSLLEEIEKNEYSGEHKMTLKEMYINKCKKKSEGILSGMFRKGNMNKKGQCEFLNGTYYDSDNVGFDNTCKISFALDTYIGILDESKNHKTYKDDNDDIYNKFGNSGKSRIFNDTKYNNILKTNKVYNKDIYLSKGGLRVYFDEEKDSELYFYDNSGISFNKNDDIIYPEIHELYVNIEFELEKISQQLDTMLIKFIC